jgi:hypothetical protein
MQPGSSYIKSLAEIGCLENMNNFKVLAYPCNNAAPGLRAAPRQAMLHERSGG